MLIGVVSTKIEGAVNGLKLGSPKTKDTSYQIYNPGGDSGSNVSRLYPNAALGDNTSGNLVNYNLNKEYKSTTT